MDPKRDDRRPSSARRSDLLPAADRGPGPDWCSSGNVAASDSALTAPLAYLRDHARALVEVLVLANLLSAVDLIATLTLMRHGVGEANPVMRFLFSLGPAVAASAKVSAVALVSLGIWVLRDRRAALAAAMLLLGAYVAVVAYELLDLALTLQAVPVR
jgi:hypothetical protein